ncbi:MAG TPA: hypothetical protein VG842_07590 [Sediminibacterium sp.]|nr:hypothetical protein [Sediminibacterium sp.]
MVPDFQSHLPEDFHPDSRVWIYQSGRLFTMAEALSMEPVLQAFVQSWNSHGKPVKGYANLFFGRFLVLMADESATGVSGCSTDSSVRLVQSLEKNFNTDFFNRQQLAFYIKEKVEVIPLSQLPYAWENGFITGDTLYFNNLAATKTAWEREWIVPVKNSWLASRLNKPAAI